jgi:hypothetical protein
MIDWIRSRGSRPFEYHLELEIIEREDARDVDERLL